MENFLLKGGRVIDPASNFDRKADLLIENGKIKRVGQLRVPRSVKIIDCSNKIVCPGLIDMHVHGRTPGQEKKENLGSLSLAAIMGGYTTLFCMANTSPPVDNVETLRLVQALAEGVRLINIYQVTAMTIGLAGKELVDLAAMKKQGAIAVSDDGKAIQSRELLAKALLKAKENGLPFLIHCEDNRFSPYEKKSEYLYLRMVIKVAEKLKCPVHIQHVSCAKSVWLIYEAKSRGVLITSETAPHYPALNQKDFKRIGTNAKMNPPLGDEEDQEAVISGLRNRTIDVIATDHAPHTPEEKNQPLDKAPFGIIGLETAVPVVLTTLADKIPLMDIIRKLTKNPAKILGLEGKGTLSPGSVADITVIDPSLEKIVEVDKFQSLSSNCPWIGEVLQGWPVLTIRNGNILMRDGKLII